MTKPTPDVPVEGGGNYFLAVLDHHSRLDPGYQMRKYIVYSGGGEFQGTPDFTNPGYAGLLKRGVLIFGSNVGQLYLQVSQITAVRIV